MNERVDLSRMVDVGLLVALATNIDNLTFLERSTAGADPKREWAMSIEDYIARAVEYLSIYTTMMESADTLRRKRIAQERWSES